MRITISPSRRVGVLKEEESGQGREARVGWLSGKTSVGHGGSVLGPQSPSLLSAYVPKRGMPGFTLAFPPSRNFFRSIW